LTLGNTNDDEPIELRELPRSLIILGAGYIALELGQMFHRFGANVTIVKRSEQLLAHDYEPEVGEAIREAFESEGVQIITGAVTHWVRQDGMAVTVNVETGGQTHELRRRKAFGRYRPSSQTSFADCQAPSVDPVFLKTIG
jgi:mercuric reductase